MNFSGGKWTCQSSSGGGDLSSDTEINQSNYALRKWFPYTYKSLKPFEVLTDNGLMYRLLSLQVNSVLDICKKSVL